MEGIAGKTAIVTGAGRGIGRGLALALAARGARLVLNDLDQAPLEETAALTGGDPALTAGSVTDAQVGERLTEAALERFGALDVIAACAGYTWDGMFHRMTGDQWRAIVDVHLNGTYNTVRPAYAAMRELARAERERGGQPAARKIVTVSSMSAFGNLGQANYAAAKAGIVGLTRTLAIEGARFNILANSAAFGPIDTRLTRAREQQDERVGEAALGIPQAARDAYLASIPLGRTGTIEEAVGPLLFLASEHANYVSGALLEVNGAAHIG
ncbi:MAG: SDR family oxidoreductase [Dehalococcoidia bacterium]|nr:SDR family oxidoreductase [Dehalococcoidia bacterium]